MPALLVGPGCCNGMEGMLKVLKESNLVDKTMKSDLAFIRMEKLFFLPPILGPLAGAL